jgi:hypothetical protein
VTCNKVATHAEKLARAYWGKELFPRKTHLQNDAGQAYLELETILAISFKLREAQQKQLSCTKGSKESIASFHITNKEEGH